MNSRKEGRKARRKEERREGWRKLEGKEKIEKNNIRTTF